MLDQIVGGDGAGARRLDGKAACRRGEGRIVAAGELDHEGLAKAGADAHVDGALARDVAMERSGDLVHYLKKNERTNTVSVVPMLTQGAKRAELHYDVLDDKQGFALVKVRLSTGRSHQIRVQMATLKCPLFGDRRYGGDPKTFRHDLALWATKLSVPHPTEDKKMTFVVYPDQSVVPWSAFDINYHLSNI